MRNVDDQLAELELKKQELLKEKERLAALTLEQELAEFLHENMCRFNHNDGCSWEYENCDPFVWNGFSHKKYLHSATLMINLVHNKNLNFLSDTEFLKRIIFIIRDI